MKQLFTLCLAFMSVTAMAQWPSLPYNPDENGDGLIGVVDLAALLAQYNTEFASAVVSEDGESAIVYMGEMSYPLCAMSCKNLPGKWELPEMEDLGLVWEEVFTDNTDVWLRYERYGKDRYFPYFNSPIDGNTLNHNTDLTDNIALPFDCYCAAKQLPRVEYTQCSACDNYNNATAANIQECCSQKVAEGWYPLGGTSPSGGSTVCINQSFWRLAE